MTEPSEVHVDAPVSTPLGRVRERVARVIPDHWAYVVPMAVFLVGAQIGASFPSTYPYAYVARAVLTAVALILLWPAYTRIRWNGVGLGVLVGVVGIVQWVPMQLWLQSHFTHFKPADDAFDPTAHFQDPVVLWSWIAVRILSASLVVPVMEELFWRDFLWRNLIAPADFKLADVGEWDWKAFVVVPIFFAAVHGNWWLTAIVWGFLVGGLLAYTKSLGACIVAHGVTNLLLAVYVLHTKQWYFW
jgi:hypothetical protein